MTGCIRIKWEYVFRLLVFWIWTRDTLLEYVRAVIMRLPIVGGYPDLVLAVVFAAIVLLALPYYRITGGDFAFLLIVVDVFLYQWIFHEDVQGYLDKYMVSFVVKILPLYIVGVSLGESENREQIIHTMYFLSMITLVADIVYKIAFGTPMSAVVSQYHGDMDRAYKLLPHLCLIVYFAVKQTNLWNIAFSVIGGFYLLMLGTRGAAMIFLVLIAFLLINGKTSKSLFTRTIVVFGTIGAFLASPLFEMSVFWMYRKAQQFGLSIRIFDKLLSGKLDFSGSRDIISETLLQAVAKGPLFGYGICADRVIAGTYAHNIVIELWVEFGVLLGTAIFGILIMTLIRGYLNAKGEGEKGLILILFFSAFCMLFLSGSYLDNRLMLFLLGLCVCSNRRKNVLCRGDEKVNQ